MRTITLEILRHGPPHNQLLSPLTPYLALCENHAAVTITVPYEHAQFLHRLRALSYELDDSARKFQLDDTGREMGNLLASVPSLTAELTQRCTARDGHPLHVRMIVSASELALLPFELAISPNGFPGEARSLLLQTTLPICLTREVRQASEQRLNWNRKPKILFAAASPLGVGPIPLESHLLALRQAIDPWLYPSSTADRSKEVTEHLEVLPQATIEQIREHCATGEFTHVHILAHGIATRSKAGHDVHYGLALHDARDPSQQSIVEGKILARALRTNQRDGSGPARPLVVTLASCNSGQVGSVIDFAGAGASVAHALHSEGIPLVIASQFPLTFRGSIRMVECLYPGMLRGEDPRKLLHDLRGQLQALIPEAHDWASLVAYAGLDESFEREFERFRINQARNQMNAALAHSEALLKAEEDDQDKKPSNDEITRATKRIEQAEQHLRFLLREAETRLKTMGDASLTTAEPDRRSRAELNLASIHGRVAAAEKRRYDLLVAGSTTALAQPPVTKGRRTSILSASKQISEGKHRDADNLLKRALSSYRYAYLYDRSNIWALVQCIFVHRVLLNRREWQLHSKQEDLNDDMTDWQAALHGSLSDIQSNEGTERELWARGNLLELELLAKEMRLSKSDQPAIGSRVHARPMASTGESADNISRIRRLTVELGQHLGNLSIRRQLRRYVQKANGFSSAVVSEARELERLLRLDA